MNDEANDRSPIAQRSPETEVLIRNMRKFKTGETILDGEVASITQRPSKAQWTGLAYTALKVLWNEQVYFLRVRGVGFMRVTEGQALARPKERGDRICRMARKARRELAAIEYDKLSPNEKVEWNTEMTLHSIHAQASKAAFKEKVLEGCQKACGILDVHAVAGLLGK